MKNSAAYTLSLGLAIAFLFSCSGNETKENQNADNYSDVGIPGDTTNEGITDTDTTNFREGVTLNEGFEGDTIQLPKPILEAIEKDNTLKSAKIGQKVKKEENGATLYEIVFYQANGNEQRVTFDSNGNRKSTQ